MKTLIVYASTHGFARKCAKILAGRLDGEVVVADLKREKAPDLSPFDAVVVGGSIHAGRVQKAVARYISSNGPGLAAKKRGFFLCCMEEGEKADKQFKDAFPAELAEGAVALGLFGGEFDFDKLGWLQRTIVKKVSGVTASVSKIREDEISAFAEKMNRALKDAQ